MFADMDRGRPRLVAFFLPYRAISHEVFAVLLIPYGYGGSSLHGNWTMNHAGLLALLAATAFGLPLLTQLVEALGLPRRTSVVMTLAVMVVGGLWVLWRQRRSARQQLGTTAGDASPAVIKALTAPPIVRSEELPGTSEEEEGDAGI